MEIDLMAPSKPTREVVLVGRTGNGKSAVGNSILGEKAFSSRASSLRVTRECQWQSVVRDDGEIINVIDTPGLFDLTAIPECIDKEVARCMTLAQVGIHAFLLVLTARSRVSEEEKFGFRRLQKLFGHKIVDYMIVVFTGGDELEEDGQTLEDYLAQGCPEFIKEILVLCNNRVALFDNKTQDKLKKVEQLEKLLALVDLVANHNNGKPFTDVTASL